MIFNKIAQKFAFIVAKRQGLARSGSTVVAVGSSKSRKAACPSMSERGRSWMDIIPIYTATVVGDRVRGSDSSVPVDPAAAEAAEAAAAAAALHNSGISCNKCRTRSTSSLDLAITSTHSLREAVGSRRRPRPASFIRKNKSIWACCDGDAVIDKALIP